MTDNYIKKYMKYRGKYHNLYNKIGGNLFEDLFTEFINYCLYYNSLGKELIDTFGYGFNNFVHIKGGSSIKYFINKHNVSSPNITSDLDILLIPGEDNDAIKFF